MLSKRIKELRINNKLSQTKFGDIIGLSYSAIKDIEHNRRSTTIEKLKILADYFDVSLDWLMGRTDNPKSHKT